MLVLLHSFSAAGTCLPSLYLATIRGYTPTQTDGRNFAVEMVSGAMTYMPLFVKAGSCIQKLRGADTQTDSVVIS
jgi:hypothetical protein